jgi:hypothetical protein
MLNIMGMPGTFMTGNAAFSLITATPFISPGSNPASYFRFYLDPTLTLNLGVGLCAGSYLSGICYATAIPQSAFTGSFCDDLSADISSLGSMSQDFKYDAANETDLGVVSVDGSAGSSSQMTSETAGMEYGIEGMAGPNSSVEHTSKNKRLPSFPAFFADWFDKQWEEIVNSFTDFSDLIWYYPDIEEIYGAKSAHQRNALAEQINRVGSYDDVLDVIKNLPIFDLKVEKIVIKLPVIFEPDIWDKIQNDLKSWWLNSLGEIVDFLDSFKNISCGSMDLTGWIGLREALIEKREVSGSTEEASYVEQFKTSEDDISGQLNAMNQILEYRQKDFLRRYLAWLEGSDPSGDVYVNSTAEQLQGKIEELEKEKQEQSGADIGKCLAAKVGIGTLGDISNMISSIEENLRIIQEYLKLPRKIVQYYDLLGHYLSDLTNFVDSIFMQLGDWINKNIDRIGLWIQTAYTFEQYIKVWEGLMGLLEDYKSECSLCKSDRFTLKDFIMRFFVALPEIPVIPFPNWPDLILDTSEIQMGIPIVLPAFDIVFDGQINWPGIPPLTLPRLNEMSIDVGANVDFQFSLPGIPVLPPPPDLPDLTDLFKLPEIPEIRFPVLPLPPKLPELFDWIEPLMDMMNVFIKIVCLLNQSLIPIDEIKLKTQIENLTARQMDPLLPLDLAFSLDSKPMDLFGSFPEFIKLKGSLKIVPRLYDAMSPMVEFMREIANTWNQVQVNFFDQINEQAQLYKTALGDAMESARDTAQSAIDSYDLTIEADIEVDSEDYIDGEDEVSMIDRKFVHSQHVGLKRFLSEYKSHVDSMIVGGSDNIIASSENVSKNIISLATSVPGYGVFRSGEGDDVNKISDKEIKQKRISLIDRSKLSGSLLAQAGGSSSSGSSNGTSPSVVLNGLYIMQNGRLHQLTNYSYESAEDGDVLIFDFDQDGDLDVVYAQGPDMYFKESYSMVASNRVYPQSAQVYDLSDFVPERKAVNMYRSTGDRNGAASVSWLDETGTRSYVIDVKDSIDGFETESGARRFLIIPEEQAGQLVLYESYPILENNGEVDITSLETRTDAIFPGDNIVTGDGRIIFSVSDGVTISVGSDTDFTVPDLTQGVLSLDQGSIIVEGSSVVAANGLTVETQDGNINFILDGLSFEVQSYSSIDIPPLSKNTLLYKGHEGATSVYTYSRVLCMARETCEVFEGDEIHSLFNSVIELDSLEFSLSLGSTLNIQDSSTLSVSDGVVEIIRFSEKGEALPYMGMKLFSGDYFQVLGSFKLNYADEEVVFKSGTVELIGVNSESAVLPLPNGYHYSQMYETSGPTEKSTYSFTEHLSPRDETPDPILDDAYDEVEIAIYTRKTVSASPYIELVEDDQIYWDIDPYSDGDQDGDSTNDVDIEGLDVDFGPYHSIGVHDTMINIVRPNGQLIQKPLAIRVFVPEISLSDLSLATDSQIRGTIDPAVPLFPVSVVRERPSVTEIMTIDAAEGYEGPDEFDKYYTNTAGEFALRAFDLTKGNRILNGEGDEIIRVLEENGRVVIHPEYTDEYRLEVLPSAEDLPLRIVVLDTADRIIASVFFVPEVDSDIFIDEFLQEYTESSVRPFFGVHVKSIAGGYELEQIPGDAGFYPGGATLFDDSGNRIAYLSSRGDVDLLEETMKLRVKFTFNDSDPVVFEILDGDRAVAELFIAGNYSQVEELEGSLDVGGRLSDANQNDIIDSWERVYGFTGSGSEIAESDPDMDTLSNIEEYRAGTNPYLADTDRDGISDDVEVRGELDPLSEFAAEHRFNDVPESSQFFQAVQRLYKEGIVRGFDDNTYRPEQNITRAELIKIILGTTSCESCVSPSEEVIQKYNPTENNPDLIEFNEGGLLAYDIDTISTEIMFHYPDVLINDWFYYCVEIATELGIVKGYKGDDDRGNNATGLFLPLENISRAEAVKVFLEAAEFPILSSNVIYDSTDEGGNDISEGWYYGPELNYVFTAVELGLLEQDGLGNVYPERKITRGEMALMAFKVLNQLTARYAYEDFDGDGFENNVDDCICLEEDKDTFEDFDGCPEGATQILEPPAPIEVPKQTGVYIIKGEGLCQHIEPIADAVDGDVFYAIISDFENKKVWRKSNELEWGE